MSQPALSSFRPVVQSSNFEHWRDCLQQVMGDCRVSCSEHDRLLFQASIEVAPVGPLTLVELSGDGGGLELWRRQNPDVAVLWIPESGAMLERQADLAEDLITSPGQGLWIAPGAELHGLASSCCAGVSILVPRQVLAGVGDSGSGTALLDPFRTNRQPTAVELLRRGRELIGAVRQQPQWMEACAGFFWQALISHRQASGHASPALENDDLTDRFLALVQERLQGSAQPRFGLEAMALALHCSARTLQNRLRADLDATPRQVWTALRRQSAPSTLPFFSGRG